MRYFCIVTALFFLGTLPLVAQPVTVGEHIDSGLATPHPYPAGDGETVKLVWSDEIFFPDATYIAPHFSRFELAPGDRVIVRSPDGAQKWTYTGLGKADLGLSEDGFFAVHIKGDRAIIELWSQNRAPRFGYEIDRYGRGYNEDEIRAFWAAGLGEKMNLPEVPDASESICTVNDSEEAKCYQTSEPQIYERGRAVVRLLLNGSAHCTGWLIGCDGHVMTNEHCIGSQSELNNIDFEWMAEGATCATNCASSLACPGTIEASGGTLVQVDAPLDYALVVPDTSVGGGTDLVGTYGFLQLRDTGAVLDERIYIIHHPAGWGKHLSVQSTYPLEPNPPFASAVSLSEVACSGAPASGDVGYWADTQGGSSGSPVLAYSDHRVVALHHCRGFGSCTGGTSPPDDPNRGVPIQAVIADLGANVPGCATCDPPDAPTGLSATANGDNQIDLSWSASVGADTYNIFRAVGACPQTNYQEIATGVAGTTYSDLGVSGDVTYSYVVTAFNTAEGCESFNSTCAEAEATGACTLAPDFAGLESVTSAGSTGCALDLDWSDASVNCGATAVYNVWRSTTSGFDPDATTPLATCVAGTSYQDPTVEFGTDYYYVVRAEDQSGNGTGHCGGGNADVNTLEQSGAAAGPETEIFGDNIEAGAGHWALTTGPDDTGTTAWAIVDTDSHSPSHSWFSADEPDVKDQRFESVAAAAIGPVSFLSFWHRFDFETNWDGGVLEYSTDGGTTWFDILDGNGGSVPANANRFVANGYTTTLNGTVNPLGGRQAWNGNNSVWEEVMVDLADFNGESVHFRWRLGCDGSISAVGWWVDDPRIFSGSECSGGAIFIDGFESGDASAWQ